MSPSLPLSASVAANFTNVVPTATSSLMLYDIVAFVYTGLNVPHTGSFSFNGDTYKEHTASFLYQ